VAAAALGLSGSFFRIVVARELGFFFGKETVYRLPPGLVGFLSKQTPVVLDIEPGHGSIHHTAPLLLLVSAQILGFIQTITTVPRTALPSKKRIK
jgi:hypothetical protein